MKIHSRYCGKYSPVKIVLPTADNNILKFKNFHYQYRVPIVVYADFECILKPVSTCLPNPEKKFTAVNEFHVPMSFCVYFVIDRNIPKSIRNRLPSEPYLYRGENAAEKFMIYLVEKINLIGSLIKQNIPLHMNRDDKIKFKLATHCELCDKEFTLLYPKVRDHCHLTGQFRATLCNTCNLKRQQQKFVPIFIHGSSNYDSHFIIRQLGYDIKNIHVIPNTREKYISFAKTTRSGLNIRFIDTYRFMNCSLAELSNNLPKDKFFYTGKFFSANSMSLVTRKGVYSYEYTNSWKKLEERRLPPKKCFYSSLNDSEIGNDDYEHECKVWNYFNIQTDVYKRQAQFYHNNHRVFLRLNLFLSILYRKN